MKFQIHVEWLEELDAKGERLGKEMKQLVEELEEIGKMKMVLEENGDLDEEDVPIPEPVEKYQDDGWQEAPVCSRQ